MPPDAPAWSDSKTVSPAPERTWNPTSLVRVLIGTAGGAAATADPPARSPAETKLPARSGFGVSIRPVTASKTGVTVTVRFGEVRVASTCALIRSTLPLESLMPMMFGCAASSTTNSTGIWYGTDWGML